VVGLNVLENDIARARVLVDLHAIVLAKVSVLLVLNCPGHVLFHLTVLDGPVLHNSHIVNFINELFVFFIVAVEIVLRRDVSVLSSALLVPALYSLLAPSGPLVLGQRALLLLLPHAYD
jgi:hypothetical protein